MLDEAGLEDCSIVISNSLDEYLIRDVIQEGRMHRFFWRWRKVDHSQVRTGIWRRVQAVRH